VDLIIKGKTMVYKKHTPKNRSAQSEGLQKTCQIELAIIAATIRMVFKADNLMGWAKKEITFFII